MKNKYKFEYEYEIEDIRIRCLLPTAYELESPLNSTEMESEFDALGVAHELVKYGLMSNNIIVVGGKSGWYPFVEGNENYSVFRILEESKEKPYVTVEPDFEKIDLSLKDIFKYAKEKEITTITEQNKEYIKMKLVEVNVYKV